MLKNKELHSVDEQRTVSERLLHDDRVAAQSYMASSKLRLFKETEMVRNIVENSTAAVGNQNLGHIIVRSVIHCLLVLFVLIITF